MTYKLPLTSTADVGLMQVGTGLTTTAGIVASTGISNALSAIAVVSTSTTGPAALSVLSGMTLTPGAGNYLALFNSQFSTIGTSVTEAAALALASLVANLSSLTATGTHVPTFVTETITLGVYDVAGAATLGAANILTLDGLGNPNALFVFRIGAAWSTGATSSILTINGADPANVFWLAGGAVSTGANSTFAGSMIGSPGAASTGLNTTLNGRLLSTLGAIPTNTVLINTPVTVSVITLGVLATFGIFTSSGEVASTGTSTVNGDIGTNFGAVAGFGPPSVVNGTIYTSGVGTAVANYGVYANGVLVPVSTKIKQRGAEEIFDQEITMQCPVTVTAGQAIDVRFSVDIGTVTTDNRILTLIKVL